MARQAKGASSLVTGAAGFIGSHVARELLHQGHSVVGLDDLSGGFRENLPPGVDFVEGSINDAPLVSQLFEKCRFDYVFHLAAYAAEGLSHFIRHFNYTNNLLGSVNLINAAVNARTVKCFVFTSSIAVYGNSKPPMNEDTEPRPIDPYGVAKRAVELDLAAAREMFGLPSIIFRLHNVFGPGQNTGDQYRNVIGIFMKCVLEGRPLPVYGDGQQTRAFTHISEVAPVIAASVTRPSACNQIFNLGADQPVSILDLATLVCDVFNAPVRLEHLPVRLESHDAYCQHDKAQARLGDLIRPMPLRAGLEDMASWIKQTGLRVAKRFEGIEIEQRLPKLWARLAAENDRPTL